LNRPEVFGGKSPRIAMKKRAEETFADISYRDVRQHYGHRFPTAHVARYYGDMVSPSHCSGSRRLEMSNMHQSSQCRSDMNGLRVRYTTAGGSTFSGRMVDCVPADGDVTDTASVSEHRLPGSCGRAADSSVQHVHGQLASAVQQGELLYSDMSLSCRSVVEPHHDDMDLAHYRAAQQRYQPYGIPVNSRHCSSAMTRFGSQNLCYQTSPRSLMQFGQNVELFYDSRISGIR